MPTLTQSSLMKQFTANEIDAIFAKLGKNAPKSIYSIGNLELLKKPKIAIVGSRRASAYAKAQSYALAKAIKDGGGIVVSGGAMGIDTAAHEGAFPNTIAVLANGADVDYPKTNRDLLAKIRANGLILSEHPEKTEPTTYGFVARNRIIVGLSQALVIAEADINSGSMRSFEWAAKFSIPVFALPHRLNESSGTQKILQDGSAKPIYDFNNFLQSFGLAKNDILTDDLLIFCQKNPCYEEAYLQFGDRLLEYELDGKIVVQAGIVKIK
ncbi:MAG: protecting protein DprA [Pseudomonadota bacterium]|jgi:DNA processing protein